MDDEWSEVLILPVIPCLGGRGKGMVYFVTKGGRRVGFYVVVKGERRGWFYVVFKGGRRGSFMLFSGVDGGVVLCCCQG